MRVLMRQATQVATCGRRFLADQQGATAIEYGLIVSAISIAIVATIFSLGTSIREVLYDKIATELARLSTN
jgi:pilus assembly protein Flp/PilA